MKPSAQRSSADLSPWSPEAEEAAVDMYMDGATLQQVAELVGRTPNAVVWKLWTLSGAAPALKEQMLARGEAAPLTYSDVRFHRDAFRWVYVHLRAAAAEWLSHQVDVTREALMKQAEDALCQWQGPPDAAAEIELRAAYYLLSHPEFWPIPEPHAGLARTPDPTPPEGAASQETPSK